MKKGSPLRMRGKESLSPFKVSVTGITPAYAGKSPDILTDAWEYGDHPCVCGEKVFIAGNSSIHSGSPLRMRGKVENIIKSESTNRITPAYAGKSKALYSV